MPASALSPGLELALRLTALGLLLRPTGPWAVRPFVLIVAGAALLWGPALRSSRTWYALSTLIAVRIAADWPLADNHIYLLAYWTLALGLALGSGEPSRVIELSGRRLLAATFLLAVVWKVLLSPDYLDGRFFRVTWLTDPRLEHAVQLMGGFTRDQLQASRDALSPVPEGAELLDPPDASEPARFRWLVDASTWGVVVMEAAVALVCLLPLRGRWKLARHVVLLLFCATTYAVAPVAGFGWLLLAMGAALTGGDPAGPEPVLGAEPATPRRRLAAPGILRGAYVATWFLVLLYSEVPWAAVLVEWAHPR